MFYDMTCHQIYCSIITGYTLMYFNSKTAGRMLCVIIIPVHDFEFRMNEFLPVKMKVESKVASGIIVFFSILKQR